MLQYSPMVSSAIVAVCKRNGLPKTYAAEVQQLMEENEDVDQEILNEVHEALTCIQENRADWKHVACVMDFGSTVVANL